MKTPLTDNPNPRINRYIASAGICSRRKADELIEAGKVTLNGKTTSEKGYRVLPDDVVAVDGKVIEPQGKLEYILLNKPKDFITTLSDEKGRKTVMDLIKHATDQRVYPVGRLDRMTTGLLLFTNDGELAQKLTHPSKNVQKTYWVYLDKPLTKHDFDAIAKGVELEDGRAIVDELANPSKVDYREVGITLHIGKNRIVRRIFEHFGYKVIKLDRVLYANLDKKNLPRSKWRHLAPHEVIQLKHFV